MLLNLVQRQHDFFGRRMDCGVSLRVAVDLRNICVGKVHAVTRSGVRLLEIDWVF